MVHGAAEDHVWVSGPDEAKEHDEVKIHVTTQCHVDVCGLSWFDSMVMFRSGLPLRTKTGSEVQLQPGSILMSVTHVTTKGHTSLPGLCCCQGPYRCECPVLESVLMFVVWAAIDGLACACGSTMTCAMFLFSTINGNSVEVHDACSL